MHHFTLAALCIALSTSVSALLAAPVLAAPNTNTAATTTTTTRAVASTTTTDASAELELTDPTLDVPCPSFWQVRPNPSVENSLSYVHDSGKLAVSVTYISDQSGSEVSAETFSRVAAEQMNCTLPVQSNLLSHAWAFTCDDGIEALVYGDPGNLVLLSISGRNEETENYLDGFISFLSYQARRR